MCRLMADWLMIGRPGSAPSQQQAGRIQTALAGRLASLAFRFTSSPASTALASSSTSAIARRPPIGHRASRQPTQSTSIVMATMLEQVLPADKL
eukprot:COSAG01_NODE_34767_length_542_cov_1.383747_1_plen_93_part_01